MGAVNFSLDLALVKRLKNILPLDLFVETGTFKGDTIEYVKELFTEIHSVELSEEYYNSVKKRFQTNDKINLYLDSSEKFLKKIFSKLKDQSVLYWLDAHWCIADKAAGEKSQCPLLQELDSIKSLNKKSIIIIDDARLFIAPPPSPHEITQWPDFNSILTLFRKLSTVHETIILNDTIIYYPKTIRKIIKDYAYEYSINWLTVLDKSRDYDTLLKQQKDMLKQMEEKDEKIVVLSDDLVNKDETIFSLSDDLVIKDKTIHDKEETITKLSKELVDKEHELDDLLIEIKDKDEKIVSLSQDLIGKEREIDDLIKELREKDEKINVLSADLVGKEKEIEDLINELKEKDEKINILSEDLVDKDKKIFALSDDLVEKNEKIVSLSKDLVEKEEEIVSLTNDLLGKEKEIVFLSESLSILKKRLSTPIWGLITLFQFHFPKLWDYLYKKKTGESQNKQDKKETTLNINEIPLQEANQELEISPGEKIKVKKNKLKFFTPRLGQLHQYEPIELVYPKRYKEEKLLRNSLRLSIVTPSYNQAEFIERTIKSILDQNYADLEYIIQDGGSTDTSFEIISKYRSQLKNFNTGPDKGQADAINKAFKITTGEIMAWINSDDVYIPGTFNYVINYFNKHKSVDVVYGHRILINENDKEIGRWILPRHDKKVLHWADFIPQETLFWRRRIWEKVGSKLNDEFNFALDWDLLLRFQEANAKIVRLPRFLAAFRVHPQQKTSAQISSLGEKEMNILRQKYIGSNVAYSEINKNIFKYLLKSEIYHKIYRVSLTKY